MKRWIALVLSVLAVLVVTAGPVAADPNAPPAAPTSAPTPKLPADALALSDSRIKGNGLAVTLDSGASEEHDLVLSNHTSDLRLSVRLTATDAGGNLGQGAASWLSFGDDVVSIEPHGVAIVPLTIAVPHDTQPASTLAHVLASVESAVAAADGSPRAGTVSISFPVSITVRGTPTAQVAIADVHRNDQGDKHMLAVVLRNYSNQTVPASGTVRVFRQPAANVALFANAATGTRHDVVVAVEGTPRWFGCRHRRRHALRERQRCVVVVDARRPTVDGPAERRQRERRRGDTDNDCDRNPGRHHDTNRARERAPAVVRRQARADPRRARAPRCGGWFVWELRSSKRRRDDPSYAQPFFMMPGSGSPDATAELAKQLVRLTEIIVELTTNTRPWQSRLWQSRFGNREPVATSGHAARIRRRRKTRGPAPRHLGTGRLPTATRPPGKRSNHTSQCFARWRRPRAPRRAPNRDDARITRARLDPEPDPPRRSSPG